MILDFLTLAWVEVDKSGKDRLCCDDDHRSPQESFRGSWAQAISGEGLRPAREVLRELRDQREAEDE